MFRSFLGFFKPSLDEAQSRSNDNQEHRHATTSLLEEPDQPGPGSEPEDNDNVSSVGSPLISSDDIIGDMQQLDVSSDSSLSEDEYGEGEPNVLQERDNQEVQVELENEEAPNVSDEDAEIQQNGGLVVEVVDLTGDLLDLLEEDVGHVQPNNTGPEEDEQATDDNLNEIPLPELTLIDSADASQHSSLEDAEDFLRDTVMRSYEELSSSLAGDDMGSLDEADITQEPIQVAVSEPRVLEEFSSSDDEVVPEMETSSEPEVPLTAEEQAQISFRNSVMRSYEELSSSLREDNIVDLDEASISQQVEQLPLEVPKQGSLEEMSSSSEEVVSERDEPESIPEAIPSPPPEPLEDDLPSQEEVPSDPELLSQDLEVSTDGQVLLPVEVQPSDHESISDGISEEEAQVFSDHIPSDDEIDADTTSSPTQQPQTLNEAPIGGTEQAPQSLENSEELPQQPQQEEVQGVTSNVSRKRTHTEVGSGDESESEPELEGERNENHEVPDFGQPIEDTEPTTEIQEAPQLQPDHSHEPATATDLPSLSTTTSQSTPGSLREDADSLSPGNGSRQRTDLLESPANILEARDRDDEAGSSPENPSRVSLSQSQESELDTAAAQIQAVGAVTEERSELANDNHDVPNGGNQTPTIPVEGDDLPDFDDDISVQDNGEASGEFTTPTAQSVPEKRVLEGDDSLPIERSSKRRKLDDHDPANDSQVDLETPHDRPHNDSQVAEASKGTDLCSEAETSRLLPPPVMDSRSDATIRPLTENLSGPIAPEETEDTQLAHIAETTTASVEVVNEGTVNGIDKPDNAQRLDSIGIICTKPSRGQFPKVLLVMYLQIIDPTIRILIILRTISQVIFKAARNRQKLLEILL
ncbi:hypothetical protein Cantr_07220 [Candida viswanathii]|uniref:Uncharacterized protein n=1 Tax=Candida viswanathii TaxID=5486 RepID=A0A367XYP8_9ASCO|nr:hypothetical protein Cantr_07220 [Candida viswanathii]